MIDTKTPPPLINPKFDATTMPSKMSVGKSTWKMLKEKQRKACKTTRKVSEIKTDMRGSMLA